MESYSAFKKREILTFMARWMNLIGHYAYQSKSYKERQMHHDLTHMWNLQELNIETVEWWL
jgi:hypothetical protein